MSYAKVFKLFKKDPSIYDAVKETLFSHYQTLINIFDFYAGISEWPRISMNDMTSFAHHTKILDQKYINLANFDLLLVSTNVSIHKFKKSAERDVCRYELLEFLVRTSMYRYMDTKQHSDPSDAIEALLNEYIYPNARFMNGGHFRKYYCYNLKTNELLEKNATQIQKLYDSFTHSKKKYIILSEMQAFVLKMDLSVSQLMVGAMYAESMMTIEDNMSDPTIC